MSQIYGIADAQDDLNEAVVVVVEDEGRRSGLVIDELVGRQQVVINRFWDCLEPGGHLFVGHSEGISSVKHRFRYVRPAVYQQ